MTAEPERPPLLWDQNADPERWSNHAHVNGERLTWRELAADQENDLRRLREFALILSDLDRCEHGRHEGDPCTLTSGCDGPSHGNPLMACSPARTVNLVGRQIGFGLDGSPIVVPDGRSQRNPGSWRLTPSPSEPT